jgi:hypothetical protein
VVQTSGRSSSFVSMPSPHWYRIVHRAFRTLEGIWWRIPWRVRDRCGIACIGWKLKVRCKYWVANGNRRGRNPTGMFRPSFVRPEVAGPRPRRRRCWTRIER